MSEDRTDNVENHLVALSEEERFAITDHINRKAVDPNDRCVVCGSTENHVLVHQYKTDVATTIPMIGATFQPLVATLCRNCGFVRFFNKYFVDALIKQHIEGESARVEESQQHGG